MPINVTSIRKSQTGTPERGAARRWRFTLSSGAVDSDSDRLLAEGIDFQGRFAANPVALLHHDIERPVGRWEDLRVEGSGWAAKLTGWLQLPPEGASADADETDALLRARVLGACSIRFKPDPEKAKRNEFGGWDFHAVELLECSVVTIPANPQALAASAGGKGGAMLYVAGPMPAPKLLSVDPAMVAKVVTDVVAREVKAQINYMRGRLD